jgi:hypothetical protein
MNTATPTPTPVFHNVQVTAFRTIVDGKPQFECFCYPPKVVVTSSDAVIGYQLAGPTDDDILLTGMTKLNPPSERQLSDASVSVDGRLLLLSDRNTIPADIHIRLEFQYRGEEAFTHDPQIGNVPE